MIGALKGKISVLNKNNILLFAQDVGYRVAVTGRSLEVLTPKETEVFLYIHTHVKEVALELYGFLQQEDLALFELLIDVSGVGPKTAMLIMEYEEKKIRAAIVSSDVEFFTGIPRIGRKNAQKIIIELKSKLGSLVDLDLSGRIEGQTKEVLDAMMAIGFKREEVRNLLRDMPENIVTTEDKIRWALKMMGK